METDGATNYVSEKNNDPNLQNISQKEINSLRTSETKRWKPAYYFLEKANDNVPEDSNLTTEADLKEE